MNRNIDWRTPGQKAEHLIDCLLVGLRRSGVSLTLETPEGEYLLAAGLPERWTTHGKQPENDVTLFGEELGERVNELKQSVRTSGEPGSMEVETGPDDVFEFMVERLGEEAEGLLVTTIVDMSEERRREKVLRALLRELSHRSKNLLAIIQSIAAQTARYSLTLDGFLSKFRGRIFSLARSQDLVTESNWRGAHLHDLVRQQLERYVPPEALPQSALVDGENIDLTPNAALHIGLALHELIVNSVSHGSITDSAMPVKITAERTRLDGEQAARIVWSERWTRPTDGDAAEDPDQFFGSMVLERIVPTSVNGKADYRIGADEIRYELVFPVIEPED
ncbi:MAG: sensor histidine kinase [Flavobacteriaceae bacterium]